MGECARVVDVRRGELELLREVRRETDDSAEQPLDVPNQCLELRGLDDDVGQRAELGEQVRLRVDSLVELHAVQALDENPQGAVGHLDHLVDDPDRAHVVDVGEAGRLDRAVACCHQREQAVARNDVVDQAHRPLLADRERRHRLRKDNGFLQRQHRQHRRQLGLVLRRLGRIEQQVAHAVRTSIVKRPPGGAVAVTGSTIVSTPFTNAAVARPGSTSSASRTCR